MKIQDNAEFQKESDSYRSVYIDLQKVYSKTIKIEIEIKILKNLRAIRDEADIYIYIYAYEWYRKRRKQRDTIEKDRLLNIVY